MTVFVDDMFLRADVRCHMFSDALDPAELHELEQPDLFGGADL